jgi:hypothetical protein
MTLFSRFLFVATLGSAASSFAAGIPKTVQPDNIVRCDPGAGCINKTQYGRNYKVIATPRFTVMVSISREGTYTRADVSVTNNTDMPLSVSPEDFRVEVVTPKPRVLLYVPPSELNLPPTAANNLQTTPQAQLPATQLDNPDPQILLSDTPKVAEKAERQKTDQQEAADKADTQQHLAATSIPPNQARMGRVYFESDKKAQLVNVELPIAGVVFEFPYSLKR